MVRLFRILWVGPKRNYKCPYRMGGRGVVERRGVKLEAESEVIHGKNAGRATGQKNAGGHQKLGKARKWSLTLELLEQLALLHLVFSPVNLILDF